MGVVRCCRRLLPTGAFFSAIACGPVDVTGDCGSPYAQRDLKAITWLEAGGEAGSVNETPEAKAIRVLRAEYRACTGHEVEFVSESDRTTALGVAVRLVDPGDYPEAGPPPEVPPQVQAAINAHWPDDSVPDVVHVLGGSDVQRFVQNHGLLIPLSADDGAGLVQRRWIKELDPLLMQPYEPDQNGIVMGLFAVPLGLHRVNTLYVNRQVLEVHAGLWEEFSSIEDTLEFLEFAERLAQVVDTPFVHVDQAWAASQALFENLMLGVVGREQYTQFWEPEGAEFDPAVLESALDAARRLWALDALVEPDIRGAMAALCGGQAAFLIMGDWRPTPCGEEREDVQLNPFPGTEGTYVLTVDALAALRKDGRDSAAALTLLRAATSEEVQERYSKVKGARSPSKEFDGDVVPIPGLPGVIPSGTFVTLENEVSDYLYELRDNPHASSEFVMKFVEDNYCYLQGSCSLPEAGAQ